MLRVITDSTMSVGKDVASEQDVTVAPLFVRYDGEEHVETEMDIESFYATLSERIDDIPTSSQPSQHLFETFFEEAAEAGDEVLGVFLSSKLSGTFEGAVRAARTAASHNISFKCALVDSTSTGGDGAFPVLDALEAKESGGALEDCAAAALNAVLSSRILFVPESLAFLKAGGRIGRAAALLGSAIKIVPVITVTDGTPQVLSKVRTMKKAVAEMLRTFKADVEEHGLKRVIVHYIGPKTEVLARFKEDVEQIAGRAVDVIPVSPVIGTHVGPAVGISYECNGYLQGKLQGSSKELLFTT
ncbi:MAG: DegV family protein [Eggerthellaceae bacterium]|nr:DegV family protein [Eggerthellaceae bacterium]